jgi:hypothetical protein
VDAPRHVQLRLPRSFRDRPACAKGSGRQKRRPANLPRHRVALLEMRCRRRGEHPVVAGSALKTSPPLHPSLRRPHPILFNCSGVRLPRHPCRLARRTLPDGAHGIVVVLGPNPTKIRPAVVVFLDLKRLHPFSELRIVFRRVNELRKKCRLIFSHGQRRSSRSERDGRWPRKDRQAFHHLEREYQTGRG